MHTLKDSENRFMITVLLVDDYREMRAMVRRCIERTPDIRIVGEAEDGVAAVALASALHPHVILMDIQMPRMDGITATKAVHEIAPLSAVVMFSTDDDQRTRGRAQAAGAWDFVEKGQPMQVLLSAIRAAAQPGILTA
jgi:DNA-binding NarL/FixJ family response regulator